MKNATLLRRSMKLLGLTQSALAKRLDAYREDGRATSIATISRWTTGAANADPAVMALMHEMLMLKAIGRDTALVQWPANRTGFRVGVIDRNNSGLSTIVSMCLAGASQLEYGLPTEYRTLPGHDEFSATSHVMKRLNIGCTSSSAERLASEIDKTTGNVVVELPSYLWHGQKKESRSSDIASIMRSLDVILLPCNLESRLEVAAVRALVESKELCEVGHLIHLVHCPSALSLDFMEVCRREGLQDGHGVAFYPSFIPTAPGMTTAAILPWSPGMSWPDALQKKCYLDMVEFIIDYMDGYITLDAVKRDIVERMTLSELCLYLEGF